MGNFLQSALYSEPKDTPFPFDLIKTYMNSTTASTATVAGLEAPQSWFATIDDVESVDEHSELIRSLLPEEKQKVKRFRFPDDQKRALLSILLQRALIRETFHVTDKDYELVRSREGKPFAKSRSADLDFGTWNFNVSHHGKYVCIVAHPHALMGADIVDLSTRSNMPCRCAMDFVEMFSAQLTPREIRDIESQASEAARYSYFYIIWSLKEAFIKAIGQGLGYELCEVEFGVNFEPGCDLNQGTATHSAENKTTTSASAEDKTGIPSAEQPQLPEQSEAAAAVAAVAAVGIRGYATVRVKGETRRDWRMEFASLDDRHVMSVARAHLSEALSSFSQQAGWEVTPIRTETAGKNASGARRSEGEIAEEMRRHDARLSVPMPQCVRKSIAQLTADK